MSERLTRKEIKQDIREDEFRGYLLQVFDTIAERPKIIAGTVVGILVLVLALTGLFAFLDSRKEQANNDLAEAMKIIAAPVVDADAEAPEDAELTFGDEDARRAKAKGAFEDLRGKVGANIAGDVASLYLADIAIEEGDKEGARAIWTAFLDQNSDHILALSVRLNLIQLERDSGRAQELADELQQQLNSAVKKLPEDVILFELARTLDVLDQKDAALEAYQRILDDHPKSPYTAKARQMTTSAS